MNIKDIRHYTCKILCYDPHSIRLYNIWASVLTCKYVYNMLFLNLFVMLYEINVIFGISYDNLNFFIHNWKRFPRVTGVKGCSFVKYVANVS